MSIDLSRVTGISDSRGVITEIRDSLGRVIWAVSGGEPIILQVTKVTDKTVAGETEYPNESFILLNIYPEKLGTVKVTYGGLTKTVTDTSGVEEPNAIQVFFGTFNGISDSVATPDSGELLITGDYRGVACGTYIGGFKSSDMYYDGVTVVESLGDSEIIPERAWYMCDKLTSITIADGVTAIGKSAFYQCDNLGDIIIPAGVTSIGESAFWLGVNKNRTVTMLPTTPPNLTGSETFHQIGSNNIIVPKGCGAAYKTATRWSEYADYIVEG